MTWCMLLASVAEGLLCQTGEMQVANQYFAPEIDIAAAASLGVPVFIQVGRGT